MHSFTMTSPSRFVKYLHKIGFCKKSVKRRLAIGLGLAANVTANAQPSVRLVRGLSGQRLQLAAPGSLGCSATILLGSLHFRTGVRDATFRSANICKSQCPFQVTPGLFPAIEERLETACSGRTRPDLQPHSRTLPSLLPRAPRPTSRLQCCDGQRIH